MKTFQTSIVLFSVVALTFRALGEGKGNQWSLRIVPNYSSVEQGTKIDCATKDSYFYVVLTNLSKSDLTVWREWCRLGYFCLSFEITVPDDKTILIKKKPRTWKKNYADPFIVKKGGHFVYSVRFNEAWEGFLNDWKNQKVKIKAIFEIKKEDNNAERFKVWLGRIESPRIEVTLFK